MNYIENDGNIFKEVSKGKFEYVPPMIENDGNIFEFDKNKLDYVFVKKADAPQEEPYIPDERGSILKGIEKVAKAYDSIGGAPTRKALDTIVNTSTPGKAVSEFAKQWGSNPDTAPTGKQIMEKAGASTEEIIPVGIGPATFKVSPAGMAGLVIDVAADPFNVIPVSSISKMGLDLGMKAASVSSKFAVKQAGKLAEKSYPTITKIAREGANSIAKYVDDIFNPKAAQDASEFLDIAKENGIDVEKLPLSVKMGEDSMSSRLQKTVNEGYLGATDVKNYKETMNSINEAITDKLAGISNKRNIDPISVGEAIRSGFKQKVDDTLASIDFTYKNVDSQFPKGLDIDIFQKSILEAKLSKMEREATKLIEKGILPWQKQQPAYILGAIDNVRKSLETGKYSELVLDLQSIGKAAYEDKFIVGQIPADVQMMRQLYQDVQKPILKTVKDYAGKDIYDSLIENNAKITKMIDNSSFIKDKINNLYLAPESLYKGLVTHTDSNKIKALAEMLPPEVMDQVRAGFLDDMIKRNAEGDILFASTLKNFDKNKELLGLLFSQNEAKDVLDLLKLGHRSGNMYMSSSRTSQALTLGDVPGALYKSTLPKAQLEYMKYRGGLNTANVPNIPTKQREVSFIPGIKEGIATKGSQAYYLQNRNDNESMKRRLNLSK